MSDHPTMYDDVGCAPPHINILLTPAVILYSEGSLRLLIRMNFQLLKKKNVIINYQTQRFEGGFRKKILRIRRSLV